MARGFGTLSPPLRAVIVGVPALGILLAVVAARGGISAAEPWRWVLVPVCLGAIIVSEKYPVKIGPEQKVNLATLPILVAALLLPPAVGPATAAAGVVAGNLIVRRTWREAAVNAGNVLAASALAASIGPVGSDISPSVDARAALGGLVFVIVNLVLAVLPAAFHTGRPYLVLLRQAAEASWTASLSLAACAVSVALLAVEAPVAAALPLVVLPLIFRMNLAIQAQGKANEQLTGVLASQRRFLTDVSHQVASALEKIMT